MGIIAVIPAVPSPAPQELREHALALARLMARLRTLAHEGDCDRTAVAQRMSEVELALEWTGSTYFEAHCGPHYPRLAEAAYRDTVAPRATAG